jgi:lysophospholipase L1-like esterase
MKLCLLLTIPLMMMGCKKSQEFSGATKKIRTIIIGSSIARGIGASTYENSWAGLMAKNNLSDSFVNQSIPGYATFHFLPTNFSGVPISADTTVNITHVLRQKPDIVLISITSNDVAYGYTPAVYMQNIKTIIDSLKAHSIKFLVTSTTIREDLSKSSNDSLLVIARKLREQYLSNYVEIMSVIADTTSLKAKTAYYSSDRIHPNDAGHALIYLKINPAYRALGR